MARACIQHWYSLTHPFNWSHGVEYLLTDEGYQWKPICYVEFDDNASQAQIRLAVSAAIREQAVNELNCTVDTNQIIWPDGTRS